MPGFLHDEIHVTHTRDRAQRPQRLADHVHDVVLLPRHHVRVLGGIPIVTPARALFDIAGQRGISAKRVERAVDNAWTRRLVSGASMQAMLKELAKRGRPGIRTIRKILRDRGPDYLPPASGLDSRVIQILEDAGVRPSSKCKANASIQASSTGKPTTTGSPGSKQQGMSSPRSRIPTSGTGRNASWPSCGAAGPKPATNSSPAPHDQRTSAKAG